VTRLGDLLLLDAHYAFLKRRSSPKNGDILEYFLLYFYLNKWFQNMVCKGILRFKERFDVLGFEIKF